MQPEIVCRSCGRQHSVQEYADSHFCRNCGTLLTFPKTSGRRTTPSIRVSPKETKAFAIKLREHPATSRADINGDIGYFLGLFLARGILHPDSLIIRMPCKSENVQNHRDFLSGYVIPRMEEATGEKIELSRDWWGSYSFDIMITSDFFRKLLATLEFQKGEVCRFAGVPYELFNAESNVKTEFIKGIGDCCGEVDRYIDGTPRVVLRFLNENTKILEDVVELATMLSIDIFDVNLSPASSLRPELTNEIEQLTDNLSARYGVRVTGRQERVGRDNMIRMWAEEYHQKIGFHHPLRHEKLLKYLGYL